MGGNVAGLVNTDRSLRPRFVPRLVTLCQSGPHASGFSVLGPRAAGTAKPTDARFAVMRRSSDAGPLCRDASW